MHDSDVLWLFKWATSTIHHTSVSQADKQHHHSTSAIANYEDMPKGLYFLLFYCSVMAYVYGDWENIPGGLIHVTASVNYLWGVNSADQIYKCARPCNGQNWVHVAGGLRQVDADDSRDMGSQQCTSDIQMPSGR